MVFFSGFILNIFPNKNILRKFETLKSNFMHMHINKYRILLLSTFN